MAFNHELKQRAGRKGDAAHSWKDQDDGKYFTCRIHRIDFSVAYRKYRDNGHIEGVYKRNGIKGIISRRSSYKDEKKYK